MFCLKRLMLIVFILVIVILDYGNKTIILAESSNYQNQQYTNKRANVRSCARLDCTILVTLESGIAVNILGQVEGVSVKGMTLWYQIDVNGQTGYMHSSLLSIQSNITTNPSDVPNPAGETGMVVRVIDGDTIEVSINGVVYDIRYLQVNTPERYEVCSQEATNINVSLVSGQMVTLVSDVELVDRYGRLLRHVYVNGVHVNAELVRNGWAEAVRYGDNIAYWSNFTTLENTANTLGLGCHPTGIFNDGNSWR